MEECAKNIISKYNGVQLCNDKYREPINDDKDIIKNFAGINILAD